MPSPSVRARYDLQVSVIITRTVAPRAQNRTAILRQKWFASHERESLNCREVDEIIKLVRTYRFADAIDERIRLAEEIFRLIEPDLRLFVFSSVSHDVAEDALQETLAAVAKSLKKFEGNTPKEFWAWCYRIARNKLSDHYRQKAAERTLPMPPEEMLRLIEASQDSPLSPQTRLDLEYAMKLLTASKPECCDLLWRHFVIGLDYTEIAEENDLKYDNVRMKIGRCLEEAKSLVS